MLALDAGQFDAGLASRLALLSDAAFGAAQACSSAARRDVEIPSQEGASTLPPHELCPDSGRRGPRRLWQRLDVAVAELDSATAGSDLRVIGRAYQHLGETAAQLATAVAVEDNRRGLPFAATAAGAAVDGCRPAQRARSH